MNECPPGMTPVIRPGGIDLKDGPLFAALNAKILGKNVGIPVCEGAATAKSPWNAPGKLKKKTKKRSASKTKLLNDQLSGDHSIST